MCLPGLAKGDDPTGGTGWVLNTALQQSSRLALKNLTAKSKPNNNSLFREWKNKSDYVRTPIPKSGLRKIWKMMFENDMTEMIITNTFGGKMNDYSDTMIPYPHRFGVLYQMLKGVDFTDQMSNMTPVSLRRIEGLRSFEKLLEPYVSKNPREAYLNYNDLDLGVGSDTYVEASVWGERYSKRANFKRLIRIKARVDPENFL
ncbi:hypothetical protein R6Q59_032442 [Mikania micrantha]